MELIAVPARAAVLTDGDGVGGELALSHRASGLGRGLELDERVVLVDPDGEFHDATVVDIEFELEDTRYVLELGARLPPEQVRDRLAVPGLSDARAGVGTDDAAGTADLDTVLELLARLRDERR